MLFAVLVLLSSFFSCSTELSSSCSGDAECEEEGGPPSSQLLSPSELLVQQIFSHTHSQEGGGREVTESSDGIFISIRTTLKYHYTRLPSVLLTWTQKLSPSQVVSRR